jgi:phage terminase small subunit
MAEKKTKPKAKKREGLSPKDEAFALHYAEHGNACAALRASRNCSKWSQGAVEVGASRTLGKAKVLLRVEELRAKARFIAEDRYLVTQDRIVAELARIAFARADDYFSWGPTGVDVKDSSALSRDQISAVAEVSQTISASGGSIKVKLSDKQAALEKLGRVLGIFVDKSEITGKDGSSVKVEHQLSGDAAARVIAFALAKAGADDGSHN